MRHISKSPMMYRYLLSFISILCVPVFLFSFIIQGRFFKILNEELTQRNMSTLSMAASSSDRVYEQIYVIQHQIHLNRNLRPFSLSGNVISALDCIHELNVIQKSTNLFLDIGMYYEQDGRIYNSTGSFQPELYMNLEMNFGEKGNQALLQTMKTLTKPVVCPAQDVILPSGVVDRVLCFMFPISYDHSGNATLVFFIREKNFFLEERALFENHEAVNFILDDQLRPIMSSNHSDGIAGETYLADLPNLAAPGTRNIMIGNTNYLCSTIYSDTTKWTYISFAPISNVMVKTQTLQREMIFSIVIGTVLASLLIYWSMHRNYTPIKSLYDLVKNTVDFNDKSRDELETVQSAIKYLQHKNTTLIESTSAASQEYIFRNLLKGNFTEEQFRQLCTNFHLEFAHPCYVVLSIHVYTKASVSDVFLAAYRSLKKHFCCYLLEGRAPSTATVIINYDGGGSDFLLDQLYDTQSEMIDSFGCDFTIAVGETYSAIGDIPSSYMESLYALDYRFIKGNNSIILANESDTQKQILQSYPYNDLEKLKYLLRLGDVEATEELLNSMLSYIKLNGVPLFIARRLCFDIVGIITKSILDMDILLGNENSWITLISSFETVDELIAAVRNMSCNICSAIKENKSENAPLIDRLRSYIQANCFSSSFSIQEMATCFDMSVTRLSQYFKNKSGQTIIDYTTQIRMNRAKELLLQGKYKQAEITEMIGYSNQTSFIRRFKQYVGQTPGQFAHAAADKQTAAENKT